ncbi:transmembrane protein, putative [Medicago truncatula]|uniref:Transmembrane protein, putative n=1 Tax=Medicago truncatula TaxID=3880 RepID=A0A072TNT7_MEDTR|nr:transmembrane protein, putative [Medicago truncatula]
MIPKVDNTFKEFLPIILCIVTCKLVSMVLVNRLRPKIDEIMSPLQSSLTFFSFRTGFRSTKDGRKIRLVRRGMHTSQTLFPLIELDIPQIRPWKELLATGAKQLGYLQIGFSESYFDVSGLSIYNKCEVFNKMIIYHPSLRLSISPLCFSSVNLGHNLIVIQDLCSHVSNHTVKVCLETRATKDNLEHLAGIKFIVRLGKYLGFKFRYERTKKEDFLEIFDKVESKLDGKEEF